MRDGPWTRRASGPQSQSEGAVDMGGSSWPITTDEAPANVRHRQGARYDPTSRSGLAGREGSKFASCAAAVLRVGSHAPSKNPSGPWSVWDCRVRGFDGLGLSNWETGSRMKSNCRLALFRVQLQLPAQGSTPRERRYLDISWSAILQVDSPARVGRCLLPKPAVRSCWRL